MSATGAGWWPRREAWPAHDSNGGSQGNVEHEFTSALGEAGRRLRRVSYNSEQLDPQVVRVLVEADEGSRSGQLTAEQKTAFWAAWTALLTPDRGVLARRKYFSYVTGLALLVATYSVCSYVALQTAETAVVATIRRCAAEPALRCPKDLLVLPFAEKAKVEAFPEATSDDVKDLAGLNVSNVNLYFQLLWLDRLSWGRISKEVLLSKIEGKYQIEAFPALVPYLQQLVPRVQLFYDTFRRYLLPILYALLGVAGYNLRGLAAPSDGSPITKASLVRADIRLRLALVAGTVIGLFSERVGNFQSLPSEAVAFLAGYGVEIVFSVFDGLVQTFKGVASGAASRS